MLQIGIIGTGVGLRTHLPAFRKSSEASVIAIAGSSAERAVFFAGREGIPKATRTYEDLCALPEVQLVCVTSPNPFHCDQVLCALENGKHVLCEKPLAMSAKENAQLLTAAERHPELLTIINHQLRFNPYLRRTRQLIRAGAIGRPYYARIHQQSTGFSSRDAPWTWSFDGSMGGGVRLAMASHLIDLIRFWFETPILNVRAALNSVIPTRSGPDGRPRRIDASSFFSASIGLCGALDVHLSATAAACGGSRFDFSIYGDEGELHFDLANKLTGAFLASRGKMVAIDVDGVLEPERQNKSSIFSGSFLYFAPLIIESLASPGTPHVEDAARFADAVPVQAALDAMLASVESGTAIRLNEGYDPPGVI